MILGIGTDIVDVARISSLYAKYGLKFLDKVLTESEKEYCISHTNPPQYIAARFAAKEAASKAFGYGIGIKFHWKNIEVNKNLLGKPKLKFHNSAKECFDKLECDCHVSLSHTKEYATAVVLLETWE